MGNGVDVTVKGGLEFQALGRRLREQGEAGKGLRRELYKAIDRATKPLRDEVKKAEAEKLPRSGGLAGLVSNSPIRTSKRNIGNAAGIRLVQSGRKVKSLKGIDQGTVRHPVFGDRKNWVSQDVTPGTWTDTLNSSETKAAVREAVLEAMHETERKIGH